MYITEYGTSISRLSGQLICRTKAGTGNYWSHRNINKELKKNVDAMTGKHSIESLRTTAILATLQKIRGGLPAET